MRATGTTRRGILKLMRGAAGLAMAGALMACAPMQQMAGGGAQTARSADSGPARIALLVPQSTGDSNLGFLSQNLENAARLAVADAGSGQIEMQVYDTAGNPQIAAQVARQAVADGAEVIVGPLFAEAANAVGVAVVDTGVPVLSFSNNPSIAGGNVFVLGQTFQDTAQRVLGYANRQGVSRIMVVSGESQAEATGRAAITQAASATGIEVVADQTFALSQQGVASAAPNIAATAQSTGAEGIFLTSTTDGALPLLTQLLPENGLTPDTIQYMGLSRWDVPPTALSLPGVQGSWFALPDRSAVQRFSNRYTNQFGSAPNDLAGLGYDGVAAVTALLRNDAALTAANLTAQGDINGANGAFRLLQTGANSRALSIATVRNQSLQILEPAPNSLGSAGF